MIVSKLKDIKVENIPTFSTEECLKLIENNKDEFII